MTGIAQAAAGLSVALGFALLGTRRAGGLALQCAVQSTVVAIAALAQGQIAVAAVECVEAAMLGWMGVMGAPLLPAAMPTKPTRAAGASALISGAILAALAAAIPGTGLPLAVILLGLLLAASRPLPSHQALGIAAAKNGLVLAALALGLSHWRLALVALPWLPTLGFVALWLGSDRARAAVLLAPRPSAWIDIALCGAFLLVACALPWQLGAHGDLWRIDAPAAHFVLLLAVLAAVASWARRNATQVWGSLLAVLAGTVLAVLSTAPLLSWLGMTLATAGASAAALPTRTEAWRRLRLGCTGLALALFGTLALPASSLSGTACVMLGYGALAVLAPELAVAAIALILRMRGAATDELLLVLGLAAVLIAALGLTAAYPSQRRTLNLAGLAQGGVAVFAFGLGTDAGNLAGLLQLSFLALTQCALTLARGEGADRLVAMAGLAGLPPFGLFPSLALVLAATAARLPWLLVPLGAGLAAVAWAVLLQLPSAERRLLPSPAWLPLVLLLIAGFAMPDPLLSWFRLAAR